MSGSKEQAFWKVLSAALELDVKKGHLRWSMSDLSRKSGVTRSLIYYYFGRSKIGIIRAAVEMIGEELCGLSPERDAMWKKGQLAQSALLGSRVSKSMPYVSTFVLEHRLKQNEVGEALRKIEGQFLKRIRTVLGCDEKSARAIHSIYWGLNFSPLADDEIVHIITSLVARNFGPLLSK